MDGMSILSIVGILASLGGAGLSLIQARKSKNAAQEAEKVRAELIDHRRASELTKVQTVCKKAQKSMEKYGPGSIPTNLVGVSPDKDASDVQEFITLIIEHRDQFSEGTTNEADMFSETMMPLLDGFAQANSPQELRICGTQIVYELGVISSIIKRRLDIVRDTVR